MDLKDLKKLLDCSEEYITTPIKFKLNGKCTNANLVTVMQNKNVKEQFVLYKGKRTKLSTIGTFEDGYCTCCEEVIVTPGGSSNPNGSGSGGAGIGGGLVEAWANAKLFNNSSENQFFCGGGFSARMVNFNHNLFIELNNSGFTTLGSGNIALFDLSNNNIANIGIGGMPISSPTLITIGNIDPNTISKVIVTMGTYGTPSNSLCTNGAVTLLP